MSIFLFLSSMCIFIAGCTKPNDLSSLKTDLFVNAGYNQCSLNNNEFFCWGLNSFGQLGDGSLAPSLNRIKLNTSFMPRIQSVVLGTTFTCLYSKNEVWCSGSISDFSTKKLTLFFKAEGNEEIKKIYSGYQGLCIIFESTKSNPRCFGQIGNYNLKNISITDDVDDMIIGQSEIYYKNKKNINILHGIKIKDKQHSFFEKKFNINSKYNIFLMAAGSQHQCVVMKKNRIGTPKVFCWGNNLFGQAPNEVKFIENKNIEIKSISAGDTHTCLIADENLYCWGDNTQNQVNPLANDQNEIFYTPYQVPYIKKPKEVLCGSFSTCVLVDKKFSCWGVASNGIDLSKYEIKRQK